MNEESKFAISTSIAAGALIVLFAAAAAGTSTAVYASCSGNPHDADSGPTGNPHDPGDNGNPHDLTDEAGHCPGTK